MREEKKVKGEGRWEGRGKIEGNKSWEGKWLVGKERREGGKMGRKVEK